MEAQQTEPASQGAQTGNKKLGGTDAVALQCVTSVITTYVAQALGPTFVGQLTAGVVATLLGAFLVAPTKHRTHRLVAVALFLALFEARGHGSSGGRRKAPRGPTDSGSGARRTSWAPTSWAAVGIAATVGFAGGSGITTARDEWGPIPGHHVVTVTVPRIHGQTMGAARKQLVGQGFRVTVKRRRSERVAERHVVRAEPPGHSRAEKGSLVTVIVSAGRKRVQIPSVTGMSRGEAVSALDAFDIAAPIERERSVRIAKGDAIRTKPPAYRSIERGSTVTLVISNWYRVTVPEIAGLTQGEARTLLGDRSLTVSTTLEETIGTPSGVVVGTDPPAGERVEGDSTVLVTVAHHIDRDCGDFESQGEAQRYFEALGGPAEDPDELDGDGDGMACE